MDLNRIGASTGRRPASLSHSADEAAPPEHQALVPVAAAGECDDPYYYRPAAPFLAHLIATAGGEQQTREHRRARPEAAARAYAATLRLSATKLQKS
jgi:hypothetical protein